MADNTVPQGTVPQGVGMSFVSVMPTLPTTVPMVQYRPQQAFTYVNPGQAVLVPALNAGVPTINAVGAPSMAMQLVPMQIAPQPAIVEAQVGQPVPQASTGGTGYTPHGHRGGSTGTVTVTDMGRVGAKGVPRVGHSGEQRSGTSAPRESDWICPNANCLNVNWPTRLWCKRCGMTRPIEDA